MEKETKFNEYDVRVFYRFLEHQYPTEIIVFDEKKYPEGRVTWVKDENEFVETVRKFNQEERVDVYVGNRDRTDKNNEGVVSSNNVWIEIDEHDIDKPEELEKLKKFCAENDLIANIGFSGGGYHLYIFHDRLDLMDKAMKERYQKGLENVRTILQKNNIDVDKRVFDLQRVTRVLGSYNWKRDKLSKIVHFPRITADERVKNRENLARLSQKYGLLQETQQTDEEAIDILKRYKIDETDKWLFDIISKGIVISEDTGGNSIFFKNAAIVLVRENLNEEEMRVVGKALADLTQNRGLTALYGWIRKAQENKLAEVCRGEINKAIFENGYTLTTYDYLDATDEKIKKAEPLEIMSVLDCKNHKPCKDFLIQEIKYPAENEMVVAPSGSFKSIKTLYEAVCIASGKKYLEKFKTKKSPVLFVLAETHKDWLKDKLLPILKGLKLRSNKIPIYFLTRDKVDDLLNPQFAAKLCRTIEDKKIKVVYFDTINPLTPSIDDNSAKDVTRLFNDFQKPIVDRYGCNLTFLHHTDKKGENYLGSMKWFANADQVYRFDRKDLEPRIRIFNEKNRKGETKTLEVEIVFGEKTTEFKLLTESDASKYSKKKKMTQQEFFLMKLKQLEVPKDAERKDIQEIFKENGIRFAAPTLDRALKTWREA